MKYVLLLCLSLTIFSCSIQDSEMMPVEETDGYSGYYSGTTTTTTTTTTTSTISAKITALQTEIKNLDSELVKLETTIASSTQQDLNKIWMILEIQAVDLRGKIDIKSKEANSLLLKVTEQNLTDQINLLALILKAQYERSTSVIISLRG